MPAGSTWGLITTRRRSQWRASGAGGSGAGATPHAQPLVSYAVILSLIAATTTETGLTVASDLDTNTYPAGRKVTDEEMATIQLHRDAFHGAWNDTISPHAA